MLFATIIPIGWELFHSAEILFIRIIGVRTPALPEQKACATLRWSRWDTGAWRQGVDFSALCAKICCCT